MPRRNGAATKPQSSIPERISEPSQIVRDYPVSAMMLMFSVGLGVGLLAYSVSCELFSGPETMSARWSRQLNDAVSEIKGAIQRGIKSVV
jgi:hypothetical protein